MSNSKLRKENEDLRRQLTLKQIEEAPARPVVDPELLEFKRLALIVCERDGWLMDLTGFTAYINSRYGNQVAPRLVDPITFAGAEVRRYEEEIPRGYEDAPRAYHVMPNQVFEQAFQRQWEITTGTPIQWAPTR